jgi:hypothetical protein
MLQIPTRTSYFCFFLLSDSLACVAHVNRLVTPSISEIEDVLSEPLVLAKEDAEAACNARWTHLPLQL